MSTKSDSTATGAATGAASGAALGTMIMPGWGTAVGAVAGGVIGGIGGYGAGKKKNKAKQAKRAEKERVRVEQARREENAGRVRESYGVLSSPTEAAANPTRAGKALGNRVGFGAMLDGANAGMVDADLGALTDTTSAAMTGARATASARGLTGGSLDQSNRSKVIGAHFGERANIGAVGDTGREAGLRDIAAEGRTVESAVKNGSDIPTGIGDAGARSLNSLQEARAGLGGVAFGRLLTRAAEPTRTAALMEAQPRMRADAQRRYSFGSALGADTVRG